MIKASWRGFEIDSSEASYDFEVRKNENLPRLVHGVLTSKYCNRSYFLIDLQETLPNLRRFIRAHPEDSEGKEILLLFADLPEESRDYLYKRMGVKSIKKLLTYIASRAEKMCDSGLFNFVDKEKYEEYLMEVPEEEERERGWWIKIESSFKGLPKLLLEEQKKAGKALIESFKDRYFGFAEQEGFSRREMLEWVEHSQEFLLMIGLNSDASLELQARWFDDGQFAKGYYDYLLDQISLNLGLI